MNQRGVTGLEILFFMMLGAVGWIGFMGIEGHLHGHRNCVCVGKLEVQKYHEIQMTLAR